MHYYTRTARCQTQCEAGDILPCPRPQVVTLNPPRREGRLQLDSGMVVVIFIILVLLTLLFGMLSSVNNPWCNLLCPNGTVSRSRLFITLSIVLMLVGKPPVYAGLLCQEIRNIQREHWDQIFLNISFILFIILPVQFPREKYWHGALPKIMSPFTW